MYAKKFDQAANTTMEAIWHALLDDSPRGSQQPQPRTIEEIEKTVIGVCKANGLSAREQGRVLQLVQDVRHRQQSQHR